MEESKIEANLQYFKARIYISMDMAKLFASLIRAFTLLWSRFLLIESSAPHHTFLLSRTMYFFDLTKSTRSKLVLFGGSSWDQHQDFE